MVMKSAVRARKSIETRMVGPMARMMVSRKVVCTELLCTNISIKPI
jgi:hypothetical protein